MIQKRLLIDFENVQQVDLASLDDSFQVTIFLGASQKSIPVELVSAAQKLGTRVKWNRIEANGKNALDFVIACELGRIAAKDPGHKCVVLSKDKGFDPLLRHLNKNGLKCRRINSMQELNPTRNSQPNDSNYKRVVEILKKFDERSRPGKRTTLSQHILSIFQKKIDQKELDRLLDLLFANKIVSEANEAIAYHF